MASEMDISSSIMSGGGLASIIVPPYNVSKMSIFSDEVHFATPSLPMAQVRGATTCAHSHTSGSEQYAAERPRFQC